MRTIIIILSLIFIQSVNAQNNVTELKSFLEKTEKTDSLKQKIKKAHFKDLDVIEVYIELDRKIDFGYKQYRIVIMPISGWDLKLNFISKDGFIKFGWISEYKASKKKHLNIETFKKSPDILKEYILKHNEYYGSNLDQSDFKEQLLTEYVVGFGCGFSGQQISSESKATLKYSADKNTEKLNGFLISFSPELQTLGTIGLLKIGKMSAKQKKIIQDLKNRNSEINSCAGCIYGFDETFNDRIKRYE